MLQLFYRAQNLHLTKSVLILSLICILINYLHMFAGVLALQLLPRNSSLKIVVITDGMIAAPDINALDNLLVR